MKRPEIPDLYGGDSGTPWWWDKIVDYIEGEVWPNAKPTPPYERIQLLAAVKAELGTRSSMTWCGLIVL
ncbi:hypothetical protein [Nocardia sp. NPDC004750]